MAESVAFTFYYSYVCMYVSVLREPNLDLSRS